MTDKFVYVTYIRTTPEKMWEALTKPEFTRQFWFGIAQESTFEPGAPWKLVGSEGKVYDTGEVLECDPPRRLVVNWRNEFKPELKAEGYSRCTIEAMAMAMESGNATIATVRPASASARNCENP